MSEFNDKLVRYIDDRILEALRRVPTNLNNTIGQLTGGGIGSGLDSTTLDGHDGTYYLDRANHTGTQLASTISDFAAAVAAADTDDGGGGSGLTNPMTTEDDIIIAGLSGTPIRLARGPAGSMLIIDPTTLHVVWSAAPLFHTVYTNDGDVVIRADVTIVTARGA